MMVISNVLCAAPQVIAILILEYHACSALYDKIVARLLLSYRKSFDSGRSATQPRLGNLKGRCSALKSLVQYFAYLASEGASNTLGTYEFLTFIVRLMDLIS